MTRRKFIKRNGLWLTGALAFPNIVRAHPAMRARAVKVAPATGGVLLLDESGLSGATGAFSVSRLLRAAYAGSCLRVRRSSDNAEQDIGFAGNSMDASALTTFVGAGDGFVVTWYDQSGNARDLSNATAADQPKVVSSGALITGSNGKAAMDFDGTSDFLRRVTGSIDDFVNAASYTTWVVFNGDAFNTDTTTFNNDALWSDGSGYMGLMLDATSGMAIYNDDGAADEVYTPVSVGTWYVAEARHEAGTIYVSKNGGADASIASGNTSNLADDLVVGRNFSSAFFDGKMHEFVIFDVSKTNGERSTGRSNINVHYAAY